MRPEQQQPNKDSAADMVRRRSFYAGLLAATCLLALMVWAVWLFVEQQKLERCLASRRTDCTKVDSPPREGIRIPVR